MKRIAVGIYIDPDFFPPTINAILNFAEVSEEVIVICRNNNSENYSYPPNVTLKKIGRLCSVREMENQSAGFKAWSFVKFTFFLLKFSVGKKCNLLVLYDPMALFSFFLCKIFLRKRKVWYHNHDMPLKELINKRSIGGLAALYEEKAMKSINFFSLPSQERLQFYPHIHDSIQVFVIPNYPSLKVYNNSSQKNKTETFKIIYQGFIGSGRALEEIITVISSSGKKNHIQLIMKGSVIDTYKKELDVLAEKVQIVDQIIWEPIGPYKQLLELTASCTIGTGIRKDTDIISLNLGTASNKIYEYAASGLPVIVFDNEQFRKYLDKYEWVFFSDGSEESLARIIDEVWGNTCELGKKARESFESDLNFEKVFLPVLDKIKEKINVSN